MSNQPPLSGDDREQWDEHEMVRDTIVRDQHFGIRLTLRV
jgi:hypothetical protein